MNMLPFFYELNFYEICSFYKYLGASVLFSPRRQEKLLNYDSTPTQMCRVDVKGVFQNYKLKTHTFLNFFKRKVGYSI